MVSAAERRARINIILRERLPPDAHDFAPICNDTALAFIATAPGTSVSSLCIVNLDCEEDCLRWQVTLAGVVDSVPISKEAELLRERQRCMVGGVTSFVVDAQGSFIIVTAGQDLLICRQLSTTAPLVWEVLNATHADRLDCKLSPDGAILAFIKDCDIWGIETGVNGALDFPLTTSGAHLQSGVAEFIVQEEFDRFSGYWWAPSSDAYRILYLEVDDSHLPSVQILDATVLKAVAYPYPHPGEANVTSAVVVLDFDRPSRRVIRRRLVDDLGAEYIVRAGWTNNADIFYLHVLDRSQQHAKLMTFSLDNMSVKGARVVHESHCEHAWVAVGQLIHFLADGSVLMACDVGGGFEQIVRIAQDGTVVLVSGTPTDTWLVYTAAFWVDEAVRRVWFTANCETHLERHLYSADYIIGPSTRTRHTPLGASHTSVTVFPGLAHFVCTSSSLSSPPTAYIYSTDAGGDRRALMGPTSDWIVTSTSLFRAPTLDSFTNSAGVVLQAALYLPANYSDERLWPLVVLTYGGPGVQLIYNTWSMVCETKTRALVEAGFVVAIADGMGSANRGMKRESSLRLAMGTREVVDQVDMVEWLVKGRLRIDPARVAIMGWSYGGYNSLMAIAQCPDVFKLCVAGAPVTRWELYDTGYTERYMGVPNDDASRGVYERARVDRYVKNLPDEPDRLTIVHGLMDENVHFAHTSTLIQALVTANKPYLLKMFPQERHGLRQNDSSVYFHCFLVDHFLRNL